MMEFFELIGQPLGFVMSLIFQLINDYFLTIFLFTFLVRLVLFPLSLKQQKGAMDRARIAPRLERLQKKYANDRQKLAEKQQELYERHGVSMTGGCLPMLLSMVVLFGVIGVIYAPITNLAGMPDNVCSIAQQALISDGAATSADMQGYYGELKLMSLAENHKDAIVEKLYTPTLDDFNNTGFTIDGGAITTDNYPTMLESYRQQYCQSSEVAVAYYTDIVTMKDQFGVTDTLSFLDIPWTDKGFGGITLLWLIPLISGLTSFAVSFISMRYNKRSMPQDQPGQGCTNNMMMIYMPAFSTFIAFTVPGAVGIYWIFSNLFSILQTIILNKIYDPAKARAEAEAEYQERRRRKAEDKKRLAQARQREEAEARKAEQALERQREESREMNKKKKKKSTSGGVKPAEEAAETNGVTDAVDNTQTVDSTDDASAE